MCVLNLNIYKRKWGKIKHILNKMKFQKDKPQKQKFGFFINFTSLAILACVGLITNDNSIVHGMGDPMGKQMYDTDLIQDPSIRLGDGNK